MIPTGWIPMENIVEILDETKPAYDYEKLKNKMQEIFWAGI